MFIYFETINLAPMRFSKITDNIYICSSRKFNLPRCLNLKSFASTDHELAHNSAKRNIYDWSPTK